MKHLFIVNPAARQGNRTTFATTLIQQTFSAIRDVILDQGSSLDNVGLALLATLQSLLEEDLAFYRKILNSSAASVMQEQLVSVVSEFLLEHRDRLYPGSQEEYQIAIRFCAGGLSNLYRDWFAGKLSCSLSELTKIGETLIAGVIGKA